MRLLASILLVLVGCAAETEEPPPAAVTCESHNYEVRVDPKLGSNYVAVVDWAFARWKEAGVPANFTVVEAPSRSKYEACIVNVIADPDATGKPSAAAPSIRNSDNTLAGGIISFHTTQIAEKANDREFLEGLTLHEVGHLMGLEHNTTRSEYTVMWPYVTAPAYVGCIDQENMCKIWLCESDCRK